MTWSIRARLTAWYSLVMIAVLVAAIAIIASAMAVLYALARFVHWMWQ